MGDAKNLNTLDKKTEISAIILAAGASRRLGRPKQLLEVGGEPLVGRAARLALEAGCRPVIVVVGAEREAVEAAVGRQEVQTVYNPDWPSGMGSSVRAGLTALPADVNAALFLLTDQPHLDRGLLERLLAAFRGSGGPLAVSDYGGTLGVPAVFSRRLFAELAQLEGDRGARRVIQRHMEQLVSVPFPEGRRDIDTEEDWEGFLRGEG